MGILTIRNKGLLFIACVILDLLSMIPVLSKFMVVVDFIFTYANFKGTVAGVSQVVGVIEQLTPGLAFVPTQTLTFLLGDSYAE